MMVIVDGKEYDKKVAIDLSDALNDAVIEKNSKTLCTVYLKGKTNPPGHMPKVIAVEYVDKTDFEIIELALLAYNERI